MSKFIQIGCFLSFHTINFCQGSGTHWRGLLSHRFIPLPKIKKYGFWCFLWENPFWYFHCKYKLKATKLPPIKFSLIGPTVSTHLLWIIYRKSVSRNLHKYKIHTYWTTFTPFGANGSGKARHLFSSSRAILILRRGKPWMGGSSTRWIEWGRRPNLGILDGSSTWCL